MATSHPLCGVFGLWFRPRILSVFKIISRSRAMDQGGSRLVRSSSVVESTGTRSVSSRWKPTEEQKRTLDSIFMSGTTSPSVEQINQITAQLQRYGRVEGKNVFYWFQNANAREKRKKETQSSKWPALFHSSKWPSLFRSKKSSDKSMIQEEGEVVHGAAARHSSVNSCDLTTLELFPLRPDKGGS